MELLVNEDKRELKSHGTFAFPVNISRKRLSSYGTGSFPWHWHDEVELTLILSGGIDYRVNDSRYLLRAGEGLFCNSDALHSGSRLESGEDCDYVSLTFHPRLLGGYEGCILGSKFVDALASGQPSSLQLSQKEHWQRKVLDMLEEIYQLSQSRPETYELEVQRLLLGIWSGLYRHRADQSGPPSDPERVERLRVILSYLHENYGEKITLEDVARQVGLCKSECCRFFKRQMNQSLFDYLLDYRIGRSLPLLQEGEYTVAEVASQVGFSNPAYFSKVFRSRMKQSPREYQRQAIPGLLEDMGREEL
ncbi:MAG: AraC family transcriptional regulator [Acutalibacter sp.]|jgi:AraC-like DNA-binding protein